MFDISARNNSTVAVLFATNPVENQNTKEGKELRKYNKRFKEKSFTIRL